jgi:hypothetical protein
MVIFALSFTGEVERAVVAAKLDGAPRVAAGFTDTLDTAVVRVDRASGAETCWTVSPGEADVELGLIAEDRPPRIDGVATALTVSGDTLATLAFRRYILAAVAERDVESFRLAQDFARKLFAGLAVVECLGDDEGSCWTDVVPVISIVCGATPDNPAGATGALQGEQTGQWALKRMAHSHVM